MKEKRNTKANVSHEDEPTHSNTFPIGPETAGKETLEAAARALDILCSFWWSSTTDTEDTKYLDRSVLYKNTHNILGFLSFWVSKETILKMVRCLRHTWLHINT